MSFLHSKGRGGEGGWEPYGVKEQANGDAGPGEVGILLGLLLEVVDELGLDGQELAQGLADDLARVDAELGGDEAPHARGEGGVDEGLLRTDGKRAEHRHDGVLALQDRLQAVHRGVVDLLDGDAVWQDRRGVGGLPCQDRYRKAGLDEFIHHSTAEGSSALRTVSYAAPRCPSMALEREGVVQTYAGHHNALDG